MNLKNDIEILKNCFLSLRQDALSLSEMERHQLSTNREFRRQLQQLFDQQLFGIDPFATEDDVESNITPEQLLRHNAAMLWFDGIGEDHFYLNESLADDKTIFSYPTLFDYEYEDHIFQWTTRLEHAQAATNSSGAIKESAIPSFKGIVFDRWIRLYVDNTFYYGALSGAAAYVISALEEYSNALIETLIPYEFVEWPDHDQEWYMHIDAGGKEAQLEALKEAVNCYLYNFKQPLLDAEFDHRPDHVFMIDRGNQDDAFDPHVDFVFSNKNVLKHIRFTHFLKDVRSFLKDQVPLDQQIHKEKIAIEQFILDEFEKIMSSS